MPWLGIFEESSEEFFDGHLTGDEDFICSVFNFT